MTALLRAGLLLAGGLCAATPALAQPAAPAPAPTSAPRPAPAPSPALAFDVLEYEVEGNTVLPVAVVEQALLPHLGPQRGMAAVEAARDALDKAYQQGGWLSVVVDIPEQRVDEGVVRLRVTEGRVGQLYTTGARYFSQGWIRDKVTELQPGTVPNFNTLQAQLAQVNRSDERKVQPVLRAGALPGTLEAELRVEDKLPLFGNVTLTNAHAKDTVPWRLSATLRYDNLWQREHSLSATLTTAPEDTRQARVLALNYSIPTDDGGAWLGYLVASNSLVEPLGTAVIGKGSTLGLRRAIPLPAPASADGSLQHSLTVGADLKLLQQRTVAGGDVISSPLQYLPFSLQWAGGLSGPRSAGQGSLGLTLATRALLARHVDCAGLQQDQFACSRRLAEGSFAVLRADWRHEWRLDAVDAQLKGWAFKGRLGAQWGSGPLVSGEQYSLGGADTVRGYREAELAGDRALLLQAALASPNLAKRWGLDDWLAELQASLFADAARATLVDPALGQAAAGSLVGAGLGLQARLGNRLDGALDLAWPLRLTANQADRRPRLHARLALRF